MRRLLAIVLLAIVLPSTSLAVSDSEIKQQIIKQSLSNYSGNCPCPYNLARNGSRCGKRSAYSKPGGYSPICYESDVTKEMVEEYLKRHQ